MTLTRTMMGLAVGGCLLIGFEPMAQALPVAAAQVNVAFPLMMAISCKC